MASNNVILYKNFDASKLTCGEQTKNKSGGNQVSLLYEGGRRIILQTPKMAVPFGVSEYVPENNAGPVKYSLDASFKGVPEDTRLNRFLEVAHAIDTRMIDLAVENSKAWFGKQMSREVVEELYRPLVKPSKQPEKYAPTIKFKIRPARDGGSGMNVQAFDKDHGPFDMTDFQSGSSVKCIVDFAPIWFVNKQFGVTLNIMQLEVVSLPVGKLQGFAFHNESDDEADEDAFSDPEF
jgi:hypothetical protein